MWNTPPSLILIVWGLVLLYRGWKRRQEPLGLGKQLAAAGTRETQRVARTDFPIRDSKRRSGRFWSATEDKIDDGVESFSKSQIDRLGEKLRAQTFGEPELGLLDEYRRTFGPAYDHVV